MFMFDGSGVNIRHLTTLAFIHTFDTGRMDVPGFNLFEKTLQIVFVQNESHCEEATQNLLHSRPLHT